MKELEFIEVIKDLTNNSFIGDDCAFLKDLGIVVTQDNFVEDVHFKRDWATPFQIGYKAAAVNISDILASGAEPKFITVGLSLPKNIDKDFIKELYNGILKGAYGAKIIGGDITGADKIFISITAIGTTQGRKISSRKSAKLGYVIITNKEHGLSSAGLKELMNNGNDINKIKAHLEPELDIEFSKTIATRINSDYAMMDSSDGLADALFKIAKASGCTIISNEIDGMFGSEDYNLVAAVPKNFLKKLHDYILVGEVVNYDGYYLKVGNKKFSNYNELGIYDHFGANYD